jgi:voltage-gated potassium channel
MTHSSAVAHKSRQSIWRLIELLGLAGTIPAFYMALLAVERPLVIGLYLLAALGCALVIWQERQDGAAPSSRAIYNTHQLGVLLSASLLLSGVLPEGDALVLLGVRLATAVLILLRMGESLRPWFWRGGLPYVLTLAIGVLGLCGLGFWWLEPRAHSYGDGLWLAFTTAATVGYGDIVPSTPAAKIFAVFVVLLGFAVLSLVTAAIAAMWVQSEERKIEREILRDLHRQLHVIREELTALRHDHAMNREREQA